MTTLPNLDQQVQFMAKSLLDMGSIRMRGMYFIESSTATLDDVSLGRPTHLNEPPVIGNVTLPCRGVLAVGQAAWKILDPGEYQRTRAETE